MTHEPDYHAVPGEEGMEEGVPSSFYGEQGEKTKKRSRLLRRSYVFRRRLAVCSFVMAGTLLSLFIAIKRGHLLRGAGHYLGNTTPNTDPALATAAAKGMLAMRTAGRKLHLSTWNIAAINNNPFEYWITYKDNVYEDLMVKIEHFIENPGDKDVPVSQVFTEEMFSELNQKLTDVGWTSVQSYWDNDFKNRKIVSQFLKDTQLGSKRLASMPDRVTNTINVNDSPEPMCRPTVINMYDGDLSSLPKWWNAWKQFMFMRKLKIKSKDGQVEDKTAYQLLQPIKKAKYPEITEQEEKDSLPLQTMCGAIFDAILVHMMNTVSEPQVWQDLKRTMVSELNKMKFPHTLQILESTYLDSDIITLQEVSSAFISMMSKSTLGSKFHVVAPSNLDTSRDQNSVILLNKQTFPGGPSQEITSQVEAAFPSGVDVPVAKGDILAVTTTSLDGVPFVVASFHGDTDGLATIPVLDALVQTMKQDVQLSSHRLLFGLDANTYEHAKPQKQQPVLEWAQHYVKQGLTSCWGDTPNPSNYTTFNARTYLQPQLNKACKKEDFLKKGDVNPKDFILFSKTDFEVVSTWKDNTGEKKYQEGMPFPTLNFPSDHAILSTILQPTQQAEQGSS